MVTVQTISDWPNTGRRHNLPVFIAMFLIVIPYNGIFSRRQIFAGLSKKHGDYFSRILIFAVGNVREKYFLFLNILAM